MNGVLLALFLFQVPQAVGVVRGIVRSSAGTPAAGVRVYATAPNDLTVLLSISETDSSGRYLLEIPPGRYYIAAGSVDSPTYYPGTADVAAARVVSVVAGAVIEDVDFSRFVPTVRSPTGLPALALPPGSTGVLSGVIRFSDGTPATLLTVMLLPVTNMMPASGIVGTVSDSSNRVLPGATVTATDRTTGVTTPVLSTAAGAFGLRSLVPGTYMVTASFPGYQTQNVTVSLGNAAQAQLSFALSPLVPTVPATGTATATGGGVFYYSSIGGALTIRSGARTDAAGRYRIENVPPGTYHIAAGFAESPAFYPGVSDVAGATPITTTPTTMLDTLNFTVPAPPAGTTVSGVVLAVGGAPAGGATVLIRSTSPITNAAVNVLPLRLMPQTTAKPDGSFELSGVLPGAYAVEARLTGVSSLAKDIVVADQPVSGLQFVFPIGVVSGRVLVENGELAEAQPLASVALSTVRNPNLVATTIFPIANAQFSKVLEADEYRFFIPVLPDEYIIRSITSGATDLLKETLKVTRDAPVNIEVRLVRRASGAAESGGATETRVRGKVVDGLTGGLSTAERVQLCCSTDGHFERLSTRVQADGSFEFNQVPPGRYTAELRGRTTLFTVNPGIEVATQGALNIVLASASQLIQIDVSTIIEAGGPVSAVSVMLTDPLGVGSIVAVSGSDGIARPAVPLGGSYGITVSSLPPGYAVKSIASGAIDFLSGGRLSVRAPVSSRIVITLAPVPRN